MVPAEELLTEVLYQYGNHNLTKDIHLETSDLIKDINFESIDLTKDMNFETSDLTKNFHLLRSHQRYQFESSDHITGGDLHVVREKAGGEESEGGEELQEGIKWRISRPKDALRRCIYLYFRFVVQRLCIVQCNAMCNRIGA